LIDLVDDEDVEMINPNYNHEESDKKLCEHPHNHHDGHSHNSCSNSNHHHRHDDQKNKLPETDHCHLIKFEQDLEQKIKSQRVWRKLITVLVLCTFFMIGEIVGGIYANSTAIQTDAAHMAADIAGFSLSIIALYLSNKEPTRRMSFGYHRSEVLGALLSTLTIWILTGILVYLAIMRIINKEFEIDSTAMVVTASCGVVFNIIMYFVLHTNKCFEGFELKHHGHSHSGDGHGHSHSHAHGHSHRNHSHSHSTPIKSNSHNYQSEIDERENGPINDNYMITQVVVDDPSEHDHDEKAKDDTSNINLRAAAIHVIGDFIQSLGVLVAALIIKYEVIHLTKYRN
jgi:zinc transporter 2